MENENELSLEPTTEEKAKAPRSRRRAAKKTEPIETVQEVVSEEPVVDEPKVEEPLVDKVEKVESEPPRRKKTLLIRPMKKKPKAPGRPGRGQRKAV